MYNNGKITSPVNTDDINMALGVGSHDFGTLCRSARQNPWAKFKAMQHDTPEPYTNAERKARQWGLTVPVHAVNASHDEIPFVWKHALPNLDSFYPTVDFVGDNAGEGYVADAPRLFTVEFEYGKSSTYITLNFTFNQYADSDTDNGGIRPIDMTVNGVTPANGSMASLYIGAIVYKWDYDTGKYVPLRIFAPGRQVGTSQKLSFELSLGGLANVTLYILPIFSPTVYGSSPQEVTSSMTAKVLFADNMYEFAAVIDNIHTLLFTRRRDKSEIYFTAIKSGGVTLSDGNIGIDGLISNFWTFLNTTGATPNYLQLMPTVDYDEIAAKDQRLAITLTFEEDYYGNLGLGEYCPINKSYMGSESSMPTLADLQQRYNFGLCSWRGGVDGDDYCLALCFIPTVNSYNESTRTWSVTYSRVLAVFNLSSDDSTNIEIMRTGRTDGTDMLVQKRFTNADATVDAERIRMIRLANVVTDYGSRLGANRVMARIYSESDASDATSSNNEGYIDLSNRNQYPVRFNVQDYDKGIIRMPVDTNMYIDMTVDTMQTVNDNDLFN